VTVWETQPSNDSSTLQIRRVLLLPTKLRGTASLASLATKAPLTELFPSCILVSVLQPSRGKFCCHVPQEQERVGTHVQPAPRGSSFVPRVERRRYLRLGRMNDPPWIIPCHVVRVLRRSKLPLFAAACEREYSVAFRMSVAPSGRRSP
jgi:hypothetical protein